MRQTLRKAIALVMLASTVMTHGAVATEEEGGGPGGYASYNPFHPYKCTLSTEKCRFYSDESTPSSPTYTNCGILDRWQNGIDVMWRCAPQ